VTGARGRRTGAGDANPDPALAISDVRDRLAVARIAPAIRDGPRRDSGFLMQCARAFMSSCPLLFRRAVVG
jgi:hypothetical protein